MHCLSSEIKLKTRSDMNLIRAASEKYDAMIRACSQIPDELALKSQIGAYLKFNRQPLVCNVIYMFILFESISLANT